MPIIIADSGPLIALLNSRDEHHAWAVRTLYPLPGPWIVCTAALIETTHLLANHPLVIAKLGAMLGNLRHENPEPVEVLALMERYAPEMDYADACAVLLAKAHRGALVVTTDHKDFSAYKVPFLSPKGKFHA